MSSTPSTTIARAIAIDDITNTMSEWKSGQQYLERKPRDERRLNEAKYLRKELEERTLVPALKSSVNDVKDANTKLKEWISVVGVVNELWDDGPLRYEVGMAREELVDAVWDLEATVYELRKTLRFDGGRVLDGVIDPSAVDSSEEE